MKGDIYPADVFVYESIPYICPSPVIGCEQEAEVKVTPIAGSITLGRLQHAVPSSNPSPELWFNHSNGTKTRLR